MMQIGQHHKLGLFTSYPTSCFEKSAFIKYCMHVLFLLLCFYSAMLYQVGEVSQQVFGLN